MAKIKTKADSTAGCGLTLGALLVAVLLSALLGPIGVGLGVLALGFAVVGSVGKGRSYLCGDCENPVASKAVRMCPTCRATLGR